MRVLRNVIVAVQMWLEASSECGVGSPLAFPVAYYVWSRGFVVDVFWWKRLSEFLL